MFLSRGLAGVTSRLRSLSESKLFRKRKQFRRLIVEQLEDRRLLTVAVPIENFDNVSTPNLPAGWISTANSGTLWNTSNTNSASMPNSAFVLDQAFLEDSKLTSPSFFVGVTNPTVTFQNFYNTESNFDGAVLEISINGSMFTDIIDAGGSFVVGGYNSVINNTSLNPLSGRSAWTGNSNGFITTTANLPVTALRQSIRLQWRFGSDDSISGTGWNIDSIELQGDQPVPIDLASLGNSGIVVNGEAANDLSGISVSDAGDVNGDGFDDFIIGAFTADPTNAVNAGKSYVVFGAAALPASINLATLNQAGQPRGLVITGQTASDYSGFSVSSAGDVNGDGFGDLIIGAKYADLAGVNKAGKSYLIFGKAFLPTTIALSDNLPSSGVAGVTFLGETASDQAGYSVSSAGDVNGDGFDDLLIGASYAYPSAGSRGGKSYLIFGASSLPRSVTLSDDLATTNPGIRGTTIFGQATFDFSGDRVSSAGDINGDGFDDFIIGADFANTVSTNDVGKSYLIFGGLSLPKTITLSDNLAATNPGVTGITFVGEAQSDKSGLGISRAGDVNGDDFDDLIIGASGADMTNRTDAGKSYVIFGRATLPTSITLSDSLGNAGFTVFGQAASDTSGISVSDAGDFNGDGYDDLLIGAQQADYASRTDAGKTYLIYGRPTGFQNIDLDDLAFAGLAIVGEAARDFAGRSVSSAGDINGDGFDDLIIGAQGADPFGNIYAGKSYIVYGGNDFTNSVTQLGTAASEFLGGTSGNEIIVGGRGNDGILGNGGKDVLLGGQGNDLINIPDRQFRRVDGGTGFDTLRMSGATVAFNLAVIADNRIQNIEAIELTGLGSALVLNKREVLRISDSTNTLIVRRNANQFVSIGSGWTRTGTEIVGGVSFTVYVQGAATLKLQDNAAPVLNIAPVRSLTSINEDNRDSAGTSVASLVQGVITDRDLNAKQGIAIQNLTNTSDGTWQFTLDGGSNWLNFGVAAANRARLLSSNGNLSRIRFVPNLDFNGTISILYRAWDQTNGVAGGLGNVSNSGVVGDGTAFGREVETASLTINAINDAPILTNAKTQSLVTVNQNNRFSAGTSVATLVNVNVTDSDANAARGLAVYFTGGNNLGTWQFTFNGGTSWSNFGVTATNRARLLTANGGQTRIRFVPNVGFTGTVGLAYRAWDQTSGAAGGLTNISTSNLVGGTTAFSSSTQTVVQRVV